MFAYWRIIERYRVVRGQEDQMLKELVNKSLKQVSRYFGGAEVPFSVVYTFALAAEIPVGWIAGDRYLIDRDMRSLRSPFIRIDGGTEPLDGKWADRLSVKAAAHIQRVVTNLPEIDEVVDLSTQRDVEHKEKSPPTFDEWVLEELAKIVLLEHDKMKQSLPPSKIAVEAGMLYNDLLSVVRDVSDRRVVKAMLPILAENLRERLREAAAEPGTGKREAS